jgi:hypothetical protein
MARIVYRALIAITLVVMYLARISGGRMPVRLVPLFYYWFLTSIVVFGVFGLISAYKAYRDPINRRAYLFDVILAAAWVPYWLANLH